VNGGRYCLVVTIPREAGRVLGCLIEKQLTTPQQYPLTANALVLACNQTTNRDPVVSLDEDAVLSMLAALKEDRLVRFVLPSHGRSVTRYRHVLDEVYAIDVESLALLTVLLLRGPQTAGELRLRAERMATFPSVEAVHERLEILATRPEALVRMLPRRPGQKEDRWQQLLAEAWVGAGGSDPPSESEEGSAASSGEDQQVRPHEDRYTTGDDAPWKTEVAELRAEISELRGAVDAIEASVADLRRPLGD
jgi:uncharacterized protein YceH (UPF0502 family)